MSYFEQEDHSNNAARQERDIYENMWTILHCDVGPTTTARRNRDDYFEAVSSFQDATHASVSSGEKLPEYIPHAMRHPKRQPHATTAARVVVIIVFFRLVVQMEGLALVVVFNRMFGVFRSLKDSHLHISDGVCKHHTLIMNVQHATLSRAR